MASLREEADDYPHVVARLSDKWRVIACRDGIQWILQRQTGQRHGQPRWASFRYCRTKIGLDLSLRDYSLDAGAIAALPERYPEGARA